MGNVRISLFPRVNGYVLWHPVAVFYARKLSTREKKCTLASRYKKINSGGIWETAENLGARPEDVSIFAGARILENDMAANSAPWFVLLCHVPL